MTKGIGDVFGLNTAPTGVIWVPVAVTEDRSVRSGSPEAEAPGNARKRFRWAEERVRCGAMAHLLTPHSILLVGKFQGRVSDPGDKGSIIQRSCGSVVDHVTNGEVDVAQFKGLTVGAGGGRREVFRGPQKPEEGNNDEVNAVFIEGSVRWNLGYSKSRCNRLLYIQVTEVECGEAVTDCFIFKLQK